MENSGKPGYICVKGAQQHNLKNFDVDIPRDKFVVFTGISGSGKSSLAFGTLFAEAQRRYLESIAPYARRLIDQVGVPKVRDITGLPPAIALQQRRGNASSRSNLGTVTLLSNTLRMLFSRAGTYPAGTKERLDSNAFSPNTPEGACPNCHGTGVVMDTTEAMLVPDPSLSIAEKAIAAWPGAWQGKNLRDILDTLGYDIHTPWKNLSEKDRKWILFTEEEPVVTVHPVRDPGRIQRDYQGKYMSARRYVLHTYYDSQSEMQRKKVAPFLTAAQCPLCKGQKLNQKALAVTFSGKSITYYTHLPLEKLAAFLDGIIHTPHPLASKALDATGITVVAVALSRDLYQRLLVLTHLGLGYLSMDRTTPTLSAGELQRLKLATQLHSGLFGVAYVLDEPSAGLHPSDTEALLQTLKQLRQAGNSLLVVEHNLALIRSADWIVDIGPGAGEHGGELLYSGPMDGLKKIKSSVTRQYLFPEKENHFRKPRPIRQWLSLKGLEKHNLHRLSVDLPLQALTVITGVSGSGKSTLLSQLLPGIVQNFLLHKPLPSPIQASGLENINRLVMVDQKPIGRTPRSNLATYTGLFDLIRTLFAATPEAKKLHYDAGRFSFNRPEGRCENCQGEGFVQVELLFLPDSYTPCPVCHGQRYNEATLKVRYQGKNIAEVLDMTVEEALPFFAGQTGPTRMLQTMMGVGLGYLRLGQSATELSGGEAQRIKLATELQRAPHGNTLYLLDEPTTGLHPADTEKLLQELEALVDRGNTVIVVEHNMWLAANADYIVDMGPRGGEKGGRIVAAGIPKNIADNKNSITGKYLPQKGYTD